MLGWFLACVAITPGGAAPPRGRTRRAARRPPRRARALSDRLEEPRAGAHVAGASPLQVSALRTFDPPPETLVGAGVERVTRRGKFCLIELVGFRLLFHLSQGGRVDVESPPKSTKP